MRDGLALACLRLPSSPPSRAPLCALDFRDPSVGHRDGFTAGRFVLPDHVLPGPERSEDRGQRGAGVRAALVDAGVDPMPVAAGGADLDLESAIALARIDDQRPEPAPDVERDTRARRRGADVPFVAVRRPSVAVLACGCVAVCIAVTTSKPRVASSGSRPPASRGTGSATGTRCCSGRGRR